MKIDEATANRLIAECLSLIGPNGSVDGILNSQKVERNLYVLSHSLFDPTHQTRPNFERSIDRALFEMKRASLPADMLTLSELVKQSMKTEPTKRFELLIPFNSKDAPIDQVARCFPHGLTVSLISSEEILTKLPDKGIPTSTASRGDIENYCRSTTWLAIQTFHDDADSAFQKAYRCFEMFRSFVNFGLTFSKVTRGITSYPSPLSPIGSSWFYLLIDEDRKVVKSYFSIPDSHMKSTQLMTHEWDRIAVISDAYNRIGDTQLKRMFSEALILYNSAGDTNSPDHSFLLFWFVLEILIADSKHINQKLKSLYRPSAVEEGIIIEILTEKRHNIVHQGKIETIDLADVVFLRLNVQHLLNFILSVADEIHTTYELSKLLGLMSSPTEVTQSSRVLSVAKRVAASQVD
jgi:hypothetical protein